MLRGVRSETNTVFPRADFSRTDFASEAYRFAQSGFGSFVRAARDSAAGISLDFINLDKLRSRYTVPLSVVDLQ